MNIEREKELQSQIENLRSELEREYEQNKELKNHLVELGRSVSLFTEAARLMACRIDPGGTLDALEYELEQLPEHVHDEIKKRGIDLTSFKRPEGALARGMVSWREGERADGTMFWVMDGDDGRRLVVFPDDCVVTTRFGEIGKLTNADRRGIMMRVDEKLFK